MVRLPVKGKPWPAGLDAIRPEVARATVHRKTPGGWYIGRPGYEERYDQWTMYDFDPAEKPILGKQSRYWTVAGHT